MRSDGRRKGTLFALALAVLALASLSAGPAQAIEVTCVEASRYKYLYQIFADDPRRFAQFFNLDPGAVPHPEACRAILITGPIVALNREQVEAQSTDVDRLIAAVRENHGALTTLYLASPGGNIAAGLRLGFLTRMFWLKAHAVDGASFSYVPDFLSPGGPGASITIVPPELEVGWAAYLDATKGLREVRISHDKKRRRCASACTYLHAGGVHRFGISYFHRARGAAAPKGPANTPGQAEPSMTEMVDGLHKAEQRVINFYRQMDAGDDAIRAFQATATQTTARANMPSMPRFVDDYLRGLCNVPGRSPREQLRLQMPQAGAPSAEPSSATRATGELLTETEQAAGRRVAGPPMAEAAQSQWQPRPDDPPPPRVTAPRRQEPMPPLAIRALHHCVAGAHERERVRQFAKLCSNGCDREELLRETTTRMRALLPDEPRREPPPSPRSR